MYLRCHIVKNLLFISEKHAIFKDGKKRFYEKGGEQWVKGTAGVCMLLDMGVLLSVTILSLL